MRAARPRERAARRAAALWGRLGEWLALLALLLKGYRPVARGWRPPSTPAVGEIDLICRRGGMLVFVEIKSRRETEEAIRALQPRQRSRIARAAALFVAMHPSYSGHALRFDVVAIAPWRAPRHISDAWRPDP